MGRQETKEQSKRGDEMMSKCGQWAVGQYSVPSEFKSRSQEGEGKRFFGRGK